MEDENHIPITPRRRFLMAAIGLISALIAAVVAIPGLGLVLSPLLKKKEEGQWARIGRIQDFQSREPVKADYRSVKKDGWLTTETKATVYVIKEGPHSFTALSSVCTHLGCLVQWSPEKQQFLCPCHGGVYDARGKVVAGPPPQALPQLQVKIEGDTIYILEA